MQPGTQLGQYNILGALGRGGMGEVWRARDTRLGREVAIKTLPEEFAGDGDRLARFGREAKILASLSHANIAAIYGLEDHGGTRFLVLELVEGDTLADRLRRGPIPADEAVGLALQIADALEAAHEKGIVHRDLKPANIKVTTDGKVKVLDFGLAKAFSDDAETSSVSNSPTLSMAATAQGVILGTAAYMAPEQAKGRATDRRADVWSFGCVLYEMLTGRVAFHGDDVSDILASVLKMSPEWAALPPNIHPRLVELVQRCLEKDRRNRYQDVGDIRLELEKVRHDPSGELARSATAVAAARPFSRLRLAAVLAATAIVAAAAAWTLKPVPDLARPVTRFDYELTEGRQLRNTGRSVFALSADGRRYVFNATGGLYMRSMDELAPQVISGTEGFLTSPFFSPDGQWVGYYSDSQLLKIAITGGAPIPLTKAPNPYGVRWEEDGTILFGQGEGIRRVSENGGAAELVIQARKGEQVHGPQLLPGGRWVLFTSTTGVGELSRWDKAEIVVESLDTHERDVVFRGGSDARYVSAGYLVYAQESSLFAMPFDLNTRKPTGMAVPIADKVMRSTAGLTATANFDVGRDGTLAYVTGVAGSAARSMVWVDRNGREESIAAEPHAYQYPRISPDGRHVALDVREDQSDIRVWDLIGKTLMRLTFEQETNYYPAWTPDGKRIAFTSGRNIAWKAANNTGEAALIAGDPGEGVNENDPYFFTPDGSRLVFREAAHPNTRDNIGMIPVDGKGKPVWLFKSGFNERNAELSPDGRWIAYQSDETGRWEIYVHPFPNVEGGRWQVSNSGGTEPLWARNGSEIFYIGSGQNGGSALIAVDYANGTDFSVRSRRELFPATPYTRPLAGRNYDISPDGKRFLMLKDPNLDAKPAAARIVVVVNWLEELKSRIQ